MITCRVSGRICKVKFIELSFVTNIELCPHNTWFLWYMVSILTNIQTNNTYKLLTLFKSVQLLLLPLSRQPLLFRSQSLFLFYRLASSCSQGGASGRNRSWHIRGTTQEFAWRYWAEGLRTSAERGGTLSEMRIEHLPNTNLERYRYRNHQRCSTQDYTAERQMIRW
jgi:hypothetical protein